MAEQLAVDPQFQVRYDFLSSISRWVGTTKTCAPLVERFKDPSPFVAMRAMDLLPMNCVDLEDTDRALFDRAEKMMRPEEVLNWHIPSRALTALARLNADAARPIVAAATKHSAWQVRAAAAGSAAAIVDGRSGAERADGRARSARQNEERGGLPACDNDAQDRD
jgi:hypothetical protein